MSIKSGLLRSFVGELNMGLIERMRFTRKLNMIYVTMQNIEYEKQEEKRKRNQ